MLPASTRMPPEVRPGLGEGNVSQTREWISNLVWTGYFYTLEQLESYEAGKGESTIQGKALTKEKQNCFMLVPHQIQAVSLTDGIII